ncbi:hypothetical protein IWZ03DRAFT_358454 [Phyllosticta citriasiana]|uniref:Uncharacterized protein n=1 Tax=Phyllosticta citriasiana TaxID=595635 RepID=A0ABR1KS65_9PEZI
MPLSPGLVQTPFIGQQRRQIGTGKTIRRKEQSEPVQTRGSRIIHVVAGGPGLQVQICQIDLVAFPESRYSRVDVCWDDVWSGKGHLQEQFCFCRNYAEVMSSPGALPESLVPGRPFLCSVKAVGLSNGNFSGEVTQDHVQRDWSDSKMPQGGTRMPALATRAGGLQEGQPPKWSAGRQERWTEAGQGEVGGCSIFFVVHSWLR